MFAASTRVKVIPKPTRHLCAMEGRRPVLAVATAWAALLLLSVMVCGQQDAGHPNKQLQTRRSNAVSSRRSLKASAFCPDGCHPDGCVEDSTGGGLRCQKCLNSLVVEAATGRCACLAGRYATEDNCLPCTRGSYCTGGTFTAAGQPACASCPTNMTTTGIRATSVKNCVNLPGTYYSQDAITGAVSAVVCPLDTFSPGMKKQRACVPCPTGYTTNGLMGATLPDRCVIPAGFYLKAPGQVAPCPMGEWKEGVGINANCTKCTWGVTTVKEGSTSPDDCKVLQPGFYAARIATPSRQITVATICPQGFICPGGIPNGIFDPTDPSSLPASEPTIQPCSMGAWTQDVGSSALKQCLTPPGFYTDNGSTTLCPAGSYRLDWKAPDDAGSCTSCGAGVKAATTDRVTKYDIVTNAVSFIQVTSDANDCYIQPGQGLYYESINAMWRAVNCNDNSYGVSNITYGLTPAPCKSCPTNMVASRSGSHPTSAAYYKTNADGSGGFIDVMACVTIPGYGYKARMSQACDQGFYNPGDNYEDCKPCPVGYTTTGVGAGKTAADCLPAPGYGPDGPCPIGTYNDVIPSDPTTPCKTCPAGTTTDKSGADSQNLCQVCLPGYGGTNCASQCGGLGAAATYGPAGRSLGSPCVACSTGGDTGGFSFNWNMANDIFVPRTVSRRGASTSVDCVSEFGQLLDGAWYLPLSSDNSTVVSNGINTFADCVALCPSTSQCQFVTYDYVAKTCTVRNGAPVIMEGMPWVGFKALPSGYTATNAWSVRHGPQASGNASAKAVASGQYSWWQDPNALAIGVQTAPDNAGSFTAVQDCLTTCDYDPTCAGVTIQMTVDRPKAGTTCQLIRGDTKAGRFKRTVVRTDLSRIALPTGYLCPSGFTASSDGASNCQAYTTKRQITALLTAQGVCDVATRQSVKDAMFAFLNDPDKAFGVYRPSLQVDVDCVAVGLSQAGAGFSRRRLLQGGSTTIALVVKASFAGPIDPAQATASMINQDPCSIPNICNTLSNVTPRQVSAQAINTVDLTVTLTGLTSGDFRVFTAYTQNGASMDAPIVLSNSLSAPMTCTSMLVVGGRSWACTVSFTPGSAVTLTATALNTVNPAQTLVKNLQVVVPGASGK